MKLLAIETATIEVGVALAGDAGLIATVTARPGRRQAETLHPAIADLCRIAGIELAELDAIAVDIGPGLFTGLRVGVAAAKALAGALGLPLLSATSLEILAAACPGAQGFVVPVIDMRRAELAWLVPGRAPGDFSIGSPEDLADELAHLERPLLLVGDGALRYKAELATAAPTGTVFGGTELAAAPVASLVVLAMEAMSAGRLFDPAEVAPLYGREADAKINWSSRESRESKSR
jgi:tRNA threonylcarbamoyladenosine biosynthesis protein TsaB